MDFSFFLHVKRTVSHFHPNLHLFLCLWGISSHFIAVFAYRDLNVMLAFSDIFINKWCEIHKHIAPVSNGTVINLLFRSLAKKVDIFKAELDSIFSKNRLFFLCWRQALASYPTWLLQVCRKC